MSNYLSVNWEKKVNLLFVVAQSRASSHDSDRKNKIWTEVNYFICIHHLPLSSPTSPSIYLFLFCFYFSIKCSTLFIYPTPLTYYFTTFFLAELWRESEWLTFLKVIIERSSPVNFSFIFFLAFFSRLNFLCQKAETHKPCLDQVVL